MFCNRSHIYTVAVQCKGIDIFCNLSLILSISGSAVVVVLLVIVDFLERALFHSERTVALRKQWKQNMNRPWRLTETTNTAWKKHTLFFQTCFTVLIETATALYLLLFLVDLFLQS